MWVISEMPRNALECSLLLAREAFYVGSLLFIGVYSYRYKHYVLEWTIFKSGVLLNITAL